jgi:hypothetical protein
MTMSVKLLGSFWHSDPLLLNETFFHFMNLSIHPLLALNLFPALFSNLACNCSIS